MINFTGAACRPDKGERNDGVVQSLSCSYYFTASCFRRRGWRRAALPVMLFWKDRARYYSWLHRVWSKTSEQPVWMAQAEKAAHDFY